MSNLRSLLKSFVRSVLDEVQMRIIFFEIVLKSYVHIAWRGLRRSVTTVTKSYHLKSVLRFSSSAHVSHPRSHVEVFRSIDSAKEEQRKHKES